MIDKNILVNKYAEWSETYDQDKNAGIFQIIPVIVNMLKGEETGMGLDLGCGTGLLTLKVAEFSDKIVGIDLSDQMLLVAKKKIEQIGGKVTLVKGDITEKLDFDDNSFDYIVSSLAICHVEDLDSFYLEAKRVLKPQGVFIFGDVFSKLNCRFEKLSHKDYFEDYRSDKTKVWNMYPIEKHIDVLIALGFNIEEVVETEIDDNLKGILSQADIKNNKGCVFCKVVKARK